MAGQFANKLQAFLGENGHPRNKRLEELTIKELEAYRDWRAKRLYPPCPNVEELLLPYYEAMYGQRRVIPQLQRKN